MNQIISEIIIIFSNTLEKMGTKSHLFDEELRSSVNGSLLSISGARVTLLRWEILNDGG